MNVPNWKLLKISARQLVEVTALEARVAAVPLLCVCQKCDMKVHSWMMGLVEQIDGWT